MMPRELYLVTCNGYLEDEYGLRVFCIGVFESLDEVNDAVNAQPEDLRSECAITKLYLGDRYDMYTTNFSYCMENDIRIKVPVSYENDLPLGG